jgi:hypothetical protein
VAQHRPSLHSSVQVPLLGREEALQCPSLQVAKHHGVICADNGVDKGCSARRCSRPSCCCCCTTQSIVSRCRRPNQAGAQKHIISGRCIPGAGGGFCCWLTGAGSGCCWLTRASLGG